MSGVPPHAALEQCEACGAALADNAVSCPQCSAWTPATWADLRAALWVGTAVVAMLALVVVLLNFL